MTTLDVLDEILLNDLSIEAFTFIEFPKQQLLQEQIQFTQNETSQFEKALIIRNNLHLPFWDSLMLTFFNNSKYSIELLKAAQKHNHSMQKIVTQDIQSIKTLTSNNPNINIAINSLVKTKANTQRHIPLFDFHIPINSENKKVVLSVLDVLGLKSGYVLESGESYHYIGVKLLEHNEFQNLLHQALLFAPIIDRAWIAHQLLEGSCSLRVGNKHGVTPKLIEKIT